MNLFNVQANGFIKIFVPFFPLPVFFLSSNRICITTFLLMRLSTMIKTITEERLCLGSWSQSVRIHYSGTKAEGMVARIS